MMKTKTTILFACLIATVLLWVSCGKDGSVGPQGTQGPQGPQGEQGVRGEKGDDGSTIYSGSGAPAASLGDIGDYYFRTSNSNFYGPKTADGWGTPTNLRGAAGATGPRGATGPAGAPGSKILSGTGVPAGSLGAAGDFYFRTTTADFYGPKAGSNWGTPINLKGVKGEDGSRIYSGTGAPAAGLGNVGDFYFRTSNSNFYGPKTADGWGTPTSLRGATGATGATGPTGPAGAPGNRILSGAVAPTASIGAVGDFYLMLTANPRLYGPKTASGWPATYINLRGATGPAGPQGPPGTANVIYSEWFAAGTWGGTPTEAVITRSVPAITAEIIDRGTILVYFRPYTYSWAYLLPTIEVNDQYWSFNAVVGSLRISVRKLDGSGPLDVHAQDSFRYVIIPGGVPVSAVLPGVDLDDYRAVSAALGIRD